VAGFNAVIIIVCRTTGASGTVVADGIVGGQVVTFSTAGTPVTINTTAAQVIDVTGTWGTASATDTISSYTATVEVLN
jgi:hypothetical protein